MALSFGAGAAALAAITLIAATGYLIVVGWGREEISLIDGRLHLSAQPSLFYRGTSIDHSIIGRLQIEKDTSGGRALYRLQIVDLDGYGLLPRFGVLSAILARHEARALARAITEQFGLHFTEGIQPAAQFAFDQQELGVTVENLLSFSRSSAQIEGSIRVKKYIEDSVVTYFPPEGDIYLQAIHEVIWLIFIAVFAHMLLMSASDATGLIWLVLALLSIGGFLALAATFQPDEITVESEQRVRQICLGSISLLQKRIPLANVKRIAVVAARDDNNEMAHCDVAEAIVGEELVLIEPLPKADGQALCQLLHEHLGQAI